MIPAALSLIISFFLLFKIKYIHELLSWAFTKPFHTIFNSVYIRLIFYFRWIFSISFTSINLFYYKFKICIATNGALSDFWCWFNFNILMYSGGIITFLKSLFSHNFYGIQVFFCCKRMKAIETKTMIVIFRRYSSK